MKMLYIAAIFLVIAGFTSFIFLQSTSPQQSEGTIISIEGIGGGTYSQQQAGINRGMRASSVEVAPSYSVKIELSATDEIASYSTDPESVKKLSEGQTVRVEYITRGFKPVWSKIYITKLEVKE